MLEPRRLLTFREVALQRSFSRAADELNLSQPAVSQQVAALERQLGTPLLERRPRSLALTRAGQLALEHAEAVASHLQRADAQLADLVREERRQLRLGAFPSALATIVPATIERLVEMEPELEADVREGRIEQLVSAVRDGGLHLALLFQDITLPRREDDGTERVDLLEEPFVALLPPRHRLAARKRIRLAELADDVWSMPSRSGILQRACEAAGFEPRVSYLATDPLANAALVAAGLCVTITPRLLAGELPRVAVTEIRDAPRRQVFALLPAAGATPLARAFVDALAASPPSSVDPLAASPPSSVDPLAAGG
jgi:DNA-binding transcriptional LysR family regulator